MLFRCSSIGKLMTEPKTKSEGPLSVGAKTYIRSLAAQSIFGIDFDVTSKEMEKGILVEEQAIAMLNRVRGLSLSKNTERRSDEWITGEADLFNEAARRGHDLKCSWSAATFPITVADCKDSLYEWQMRGYMRLWSADAWEVNYALITTPESLTKWEPLFMHFVDHIPEHMRITTWIVERDKEKEDRMIENVKHAREYFAQVVEEFAATHQPAQTIHLLPAGPSMNDDQPESTEQNSETARLQREAEADRARAAQIESDRIAREQAEVVSAARIRDEQIRNNQAEAAQRMNQVLSAAVLHNPSVDAFQPTETLRQHGEAEEITDDGARLTLGQINERLAPVSITVAGLADLGFEPVEQIKAARMYKACDFPAICNAISKHVLAAAQMEAA